MHLDTVRKIFNSVSVRNLNTEIENVGKMLSTSVHLNSDAPKNLILSIPKCRNNAINKRSYNYCSNTLRKQFYSTELPEETIDSNTFERVCEETLNSLADYFEDLVASDPKLEKADVVYGVGVLTIDLGDHGTYVINRQAPNKQIWLSSPTSGPKRFDYLVEEDCWIYKHDGRKLHSLLKQEFESIVGKELNISSCLHSSLTRKT